jgi:hypothetical protein
MDQRGIVTIVLPISSWPSRASIDGVQVPLLFTFNANYYQNVAYIYIMCMQKQTSYKYIVSSQGDRPLAS